MFVHSLASKYARFVIIVRQIYWTPPFRPLDPPLLKSDDLFFREPRDIGPPPFQKSWIRPCFNIQSEGVHISALKHCEKIKFNTYVSSDTQILKL